MYDIRGSSFSAPCPTTEHFCPPLLIIVKSAPRRKRTFPQLGHSGGPREHILAVGLSHLSFPALCPRAEQHTKLYPWVLIGKSKEMKRQFPSAS